MTYLAIYIKSQNRVLPEPHCRFAVELVVILFFFFHRCIFNLYSATVSTGYCCRDYTSKFLTRIFDLARNLLLNYSLVEETSTTLIVISLCICICIVAHSSLSNLSL